MKHSLTRDEVVNILKEGNRVRSGTVDIVYKNGNSGSGFAVVVPKKVVKEAVDRNKIRRMIRGIVQKTAEPGIKFVILYKGGVSSRRSLTQEIETAMEKLL